MGKKSYELMLQRVHQVVRAAKLFEEFERAEHFTLHVENEPYMALVIKSWPTPDPLQGERRRILVAHYFVEKEREFPDPELEMTEYGFPVRLRQTAFGVMETPVLWRDPATQQVLVNVRGKREMAELLRLVEETFQPIKPFTNRLLYAQRAHLCCTSVTFDLSLKEDPYVSENIWPTME